ncbi:DUF2690 domain-containing protein [Streptomyces sp. NPDC091273]|uniref:DUF2690 domain-containing protein n=1 Tax=Streptomyces sp. NPDC091273 TaxID=3365982 RepID=UPI0037FF7C32
MDPASHGRGGGVGRLCEPGPTAENKRSGAQLRYSPSCRAAWGPFKIKAPSGSRVGSRTARAGSTRTNGSGRFYSVVINDEDVKAWACGIRPSGFGGTNTACTGDYRGEGEAWPGIRP